MSNYVNYILMILGIFTILTAMILIFLDKLKGEDIYFNMDVKEQELKKVMEDAEEIISELNYTSDMVVKEIEEKLEDVYAPSTAGSPRPLKRTPRTAAPGGPYTAAPVGAVPRADRRTSEGGDRNETRQQRHAEAYGAFEAYRQNMIYGRDGAHHDDNPYHDEADLETAQDIQEEIPVAPEKKDEPQISPKQKAVLDYAAQGMSVTEIAKKMNVGQGEVMLILSIKNEGLTNE